MTSSGITNPFRRYQRMMGYKPGLKISKMTKDEFEKRLREECKRRQSEPDTRTTEEKEHDRQCHEEFEKAINIARNRKRYGETLAKLPFNAYMSD